MIHGVCRKEGHGKAAVLENDRDCKDLVAFSETSINEWLESSGMVSGERIGKSPIGDIQGNQPRVDQNNEG